MPATLAAHPYAQLAHRPTTCPAGRLAGCRHTCSSVPGARGRQPAAPYGSSDHAGRADPTGVRLTSVLRNTGGETGSMMQLACSTAGAGSWAAAVHPARPGILPAQASCPPRQSPSPWFVPTASQYACNPNTLHALLQLLAHPLTRQRMARAAVLLEYATLPLVAIQPQAGHVVPGGAILAGGWRW